MIFACPYLQGSLGSRAIKLHFSHLQALMAHWRLSNADFDPKDLL
jgi:hypothetical protein